MEKGWDFALTVAAVLALCVCDGGRTGTFVRKTDFSRDMPIESDVFRLPPGYNPPQQV